MKKLSFLENIMEEFYAKIYASEEFKNYIKYDCETLEELKK